MDNMDILKNGKFIPSTQRPDGTWRKARRVKDGYVPQEEVPLYESKGKQFAKTQYLPVGLSPLVAQAAMEKREKELKQKNRLAALQDKITNQDSKKVNANNSGAKSRKKEIKVNSVTVAIANIDLSSEEDVQKQIKKLRKKIREIEAIEKKLEHGELKSPEQDQLDKVARKSTILKQLEDLEKLQK